MNRFIKTYGERLVAAFLAVAVLCSLGWFWRSRAEVRRIKSIPVLVHLVKSTPPPAIPLAQKVSSSLWSEPMAQSAGSGWIYELFTPPVVFYDQKAAVFSVSPPSNRADSGSGFNLELVSVQREIYPLQLSGYFGETGSYTAAFTSPGKPGTILAREGKRFEELGLTLRNFSVNRVALVHPEAWPVYEVVARAEMYEEQSGGIIVLDSRGQKFSDAPVATVRILNLEGALRNVREGDAVAAPDGIYRIVQVRYAPATILVTCERSDGSKIENKVLHPAGASSIDVATTAEDSKLLTSRPATGFVTNDK